MPTTNAVPAFAMAMGVQIDAPLVLANPDDAHWDDAADLVIVGLGGAGVAAGLQAVEQGMSVIALDRFAQGGSTAANGGVFYAGGGTAIQRAAGIEDRPEDMLAYLSMEAGEVISRPALERFVAGSPETIDWIMSHGGRFDPSYWPHKASYPPLDKFLYHPDNSLVAEYAAKAKPAPRGHRAYARNGKKAWGLGRAITARLEEAALAKGMRLLRYAQARQLVMDDAGRVIGVAGMRIMPGRDADRFARLLTRADRMLAALPPSFPLSALTIALGRRSLNKAFAIAQRAAVPFMVRAQRGVQISAGGYVLNRAMLAHFAPKFLKAMPNGTLGDDGSGILLGASAGGTTALMERISAWRFINPPKAWSDAIVVNAGGQRFVDETVYGATMGDCIAQQPGGKAWVIYDAASRKAAFAQARDKRIVPFQRQVTMINLLFNARRANTLTALADKLAMPAAALSETVARYNDVIAGNGTDAFGKTVHDMRPIARGPFYAMDASIDSRLLALAIMSVGGLRVDEDTGGVLGPDGAAIKGLYAAGRSAIGLCSQTYVSGLSFADCIFSGRRVAQDLADRGV
ncbi:FAD-binding protein [Croceicoccus sp. F390]|uniref:FAD-binding protein n=1 Tax=Croceicoccus esteveae TaxID=3075597 RepID=A0ABU2ZFH4_9SPHN|nr:FAD-binding protein [Croceicoccus sp. F390]MDT0575349.1 FAD-binding protein [Croceicoccus sp. F390]